MIFKRRGGDADDEIEDDEDEDVDYVLFRGALNGRNPDMTKHARLAQSGLMPTKDLVTDALLRRADMIRIEPKGNAAMIRLFIDGVPYPGGRMAKPQLVAVTQILKLLSGLDPRVRKPQEGGVKAELDGVSYELKVQMEPMAGGVDRITIRTRDTKKFPDAPEDLGIHDALRVKLRELITGKHGVFLTCGQTLSGVTTSAHGVVKAMDLYIYNVFLLHDPGFEIPMVNKFEKKDAEEDLDSQIQRCLRKEPNVMYVGKVNDQKFDTIHRYTDEVSFVGEMDAPDPITGLLRTIDWTDDPELITNTVSGLMASRLIRKLCESCKQAFRPNPKVLAKVGLPPETKVLYRANRAEQDDEDFEVCEKCGGTGYLGRVGLFELLEMTDEMKELVLAGADPKAIRAHMRSSKMFTHQREGLRMVADGTTSLEELQRIFRR
ncbi:ATPase, T2SS/T4P/T4SS family [Calycomorphotria hydatis]|uniref:Type II secretion system protein E n=1 Tax=Calycomorphotria hydatis TaxID=2528027 RepID=A0A517T7R0_9PLAN|nr:ATPase, T2SS/T4P/T4SS family [Calycomorphotria hydatis]QDT64415.1 Type II secretion system protein E [Calycomorphotria hydatis]